MLIVEVNDLKLLKCIDTDGFLIGTDKISSEVFVKFPKEKVLEFVKEVHQNKKIVILDATNIFHDQDLAGIKEILDYLSEVDFVMYNDLAIMNMVPIEKRIYYSTTYVTNLYDFDIVKEENAYVVVSPELSFEELKAFNQKDGSFIIGFGTWEIFHSRRRLLSNYFKYRKTDYFNGRYHIIEEFRNEMYPIVEDEGTKIYLNGYYYLASELKELSKNILLKTFDLEYENVVKIVHAYNEAIINGDYEKLENIIKEFPINTNKGLLYEESILTKGVKERG